jgi:hypothetical protein
MRVIVHKIKLKPGVPSAQFEEWVRNTDYRACSDLPSVAKFSVQRVSDSPNAPYHFFEVIHVTSDEAFARDMQTSLFQGLVAAFSKMADVVEELSGELIEPGFKR